MLLLINELEISNTPIDETAPGLTAVPVPMPEPPDE
jgi:hypothetical protein